ncbi:MAG: hypothetical protein RRY54_03920 [Angelakisella sp.]
MEKQEQEAWERFCGSGAIGDYLSYRASVGFSRKNETDRQTVTEVEDSAYIDRCGGYTGKASGGAGSPPHSADP